ncbi:hypothetical protein FRB96_006045 [Tulasnella sp. 330]|nr:hypothetical protein FRB96_006045 [Tulasnella sp. 330]
MFAALSTAKPSAITASPSLNSAPTKLLNFCNNDNEDVTVFLRDVKRIAHTQGRQADDKWLVEYVELCLAGEALRWFSELDDEVAGSWKPLRRAFLQRFKSPRVVSELSPAAPPGASWQLASVVPYPANDLVPQSPPKHNSSFKIFLSGDSGKSVGKSALVNRFVEGTWDAMIKYTAGAEFRTKTMQVDERQIELQLWSTGRNERFMAISTSYYKGSQGIMILYDVTNRPSFQNVSKWKAEIDKYAEDAVTMLIANKCEDPTRRAVPREEGIQMAQKLRVHFAEMSVKTTEGVEEAFTFLISSNSAPTKLLNFCGNDNEDVTIFLRDVKRLAHTQGRQDDDKWLVDYVELCLAGEALRWFSELDDEVVRLWKSLRRAFLQRFKPPTAPLEPPAAVPPTVKSRPASIVPFPAEPSDLVPPNSPKPAPILVKLVVIGDTAVGKTDLVTRYCTGTWVKPGTATVGIDFKIKTIQVGGAPVKLQIIITHREAW